MKVYRYIKLRIISTILIVLVLVSSVGFLTYRQFNKVLTSVSDAAKPDVSIALTKGLLYDLTQAENSVKTYTLTKDSIYLVNYRFFYEKISDKLMAMKAYDETVHEQELPFDSLETLINLKFQILDEFIAIQNEFRVEEALIKVSEKIDKVVIKEVDPKKSYFDWKTWKRVNPEIPQSIEDMKRDLQQIKKLETIKEEEHRALELELLLFDRRVTNNIQEIILNLEQADIKKVNDEALEIEDAVKMTNVQILIFCIVISLLLIFMSFTIIKYITNNNRYRRALKKAQHETILLAKAKQHFVATVSHEIRTPMNIIVGFTEQLSQSKLNKNQGEQIEMIQKASGHLLKLINEVLDFTKLENGKLTFERIGFKPELVVKEIVDLMTPAGETKELLIEFMVKSNVPEILVGDAFRLKQILLNVIGNALKFTSKGKISIELESDPITNDTPNILRMRVIDTGIGMDQDKADVVFNEFEQAENNTSSTYGGTGLGLSITKKLVELQGGTIKIDSKSGEGTTVTIEIPYTVGKLADIVLEEEFSSMHFDLSNVKILVVDDESFNRKLLLAILEKYNAVLTEAKDGLEAVEAVEKSDFDLILMDARMPNMDGVTASRKILKIGKSKNLVIPIIALTAAVTEEDRQIYKRAGMIEFIAKPYKEAKLMGKIKSVLHMEAPLNESIKENESEEDVRIDFSELKKLSSDDHDFYTDMLRTFIDNTKEGMREIRTGFDAKNWSIVAEFAHKISSPCKHLSANKLYQLLKTIEMNCRGIENLEDIPQLVAEAESEAEWVISEIEKELLG